MDNGNAFPPGFSEQDILFECPQCGKSLGIDERGAGLIVTCPDCGTKMQVPVPERSAGFMTVADYTRPPGLAAVSGGSSRAARLEASAEEIDQRKRYLEKLRIDHALRFERIREEWAAIQAAVDRMAEMLKDVGETPPAKGV
jgi:DNA-directed RNA polymerase subunit RPC12/RpoP